MGWQLLDYAPKSECLKNILCVFFCVNSLRALREKRREQREQREKRKEQRTKTGIKSALSGIFKRIKGLIDKLCSYQESLI